MLSNTAKRHLASLAFLVFSAVLLVAVLRTPLPAAWPWWT